MKSILPVRPKLPTPTKITVPLLIVAAFFLPSPFVILSPGTPQNILGSAITINNRSLSNGMYYYSLSINDKAIAQGKFTIIK